MKQKLTHSGGPSSAGLARLGAQKKKMTAALLLIGLMVLMWARVLLTRGPEAAQAGEGRMRAGPAGSGQEVQVAVSFVELPKVKGRNDLLVRDFFASQNWRNFAQSRRGNSSGAGEVRIVSKDGDAEIARRVAEKLNLQAIWVDNNPQAFINGKPFTVGDKFRLKEGVSAYECEVIGIEESTVYLKCGKAKIVLSLAEAVGQNN